jgi:nucleoid-associated protein YgaU
VIPSSFDLTAPEDWSAASPTPGTVALLVEPERDGDPFRCAVSLIFEDVAGDDIDLARYTRTRIASLAGVLTDALVIDQQPTTLAGAEAIVSTIGYRQGSDALTLRQWSAIAGDTGVLLGAVCPNDRFPGLQPTLDEIAQSLALETQP